MTFTCSHGSLSLLDGSAVSYCNRRSRICLRTCLPIVCWGLLIQRSIHADFIASLGLTLWFSSAFWSCYLVSRLYALSWLKRNYVVFLFLLSLFTFCGSLQCFVKENSFVQNVFLFSRSLPGAATTGLQSFAAEICAISMVLVGYFGRSPICKPLVSWTTRPSQDHHSTHNSLAELHIKLPGAAPISEAFGRDGCLRRCAASRECLDVFCV